MAHVRKARAGAILAIDSNVLRDPPPEDVEQRYRAAEAAAIDVAIGAVKKLATHS